MSPRFSHFISPQGLGALVFGLFATLGLFSGIHSIEYNKLKRALERDAESRMAAVKAGMIEAENALAAVNQLFSTMNNVSRTQFHAFTQPLLARHSHIWAFSFERIVDAKERKSFEKRHKTQYPDFRITEFSNGKLVTAPEREQYRVLTYLEPSQGNEAFLGLNVAARAEQKVATQRACETGAASATDVFNLAKGKGTQRGFAILMPVYRPGATFDSPQSRCQSVIGYTGVVLRDAEFMEKIKKVHGAGAFGTYAMSIYAGNDPDEKNFAFHVGDTSAETSDHEVFQDWFNLRPPSISDTFDVAGQPWHIVMSTNSTPLLTNYLGSLLTLIGGLLASLLAAAYMHMLVLRSRRIQILVRERTKALSETNQSLLLREQAIEACVNSIIITSAQGPNYPIEYVNPAFEKMTGFSSAEILGCSCSILWGKDREQAGVKEIITGVRRKEEVMATLRTYRKDGETFWSKVYIAPVANAVGEINHFVVAHYDITEAKRYENELEYQANHDALTGLANRKLLYSRLGEAMEDARRNGRAVWVLFINIDRFKFINESLGHQVGDMVLKEVSRRLQAAASGYDAIARIGADEFIAALTERPDQSLDTTAQDFIAAVSRPITIEGTQLFLRCSAGISVFPDNGESPDTLIAHADLALRRAKEFGRNNLQFYMPEMSESVRARANIEGALRDAIERSEFMLHYQPQVDLCTGRMVGVEALLRWQHPQMGLVMPDSFIEIAEDTGLIVPIGAWVLRAACMQAKTWLDAGHGDFRVAVNLSSRQFMQPGLVRLVATILKETGLPGHLLELELTERLVMDDVAHVIEVLADLRALGVKLLIDDFGTGYSSLAYLKNFPIDGLKIDQSFVQEIAPYSHDAAIADAIISMAHGLGIRVVAEGVETEAQCEFLAHNMCDEIQGFLFSRPIAANEIDALLKEGRALPEYLRRLQKRKRTLLLVDDEPNILAALKRLVRSAGYQVLTANSGSEGLEVLANNEVDVIVSDQRMPGMTGVEFLRAVKTLHPETVRIVLSGFTELQSVTDAVNEGAIYKFLAKPWDDAQLREHIEKAFQHKEMEDENRRLDIQVRTANQELARTNRQLEEVLKQKQQKMQRDEITLDIVREALQHVPLPIIGIDEDEIVVFANVAAQSLFKRAGLILGSEITQLMPDMVHVLHRAGEGEKCITELDGRRFEIVSRSMGRGTQSRGKLITFTPGAEA